MSKHKKIGHCSCCLERLWDGRDSTIKTDTWPGVQATTMLADGSLMDVTLCDACTQDPDLEDIWETVIQGWDAEGSFDYASKQSRTNFILDVLYTTPWAIIDKNDFLRS